jgi:hypothetical protein
MYEILDDDQAWSKHVAREIRMILDLIWMCIFIFDIDVLIIIIIIIIIT